ALPRRVAAARGEGAGPLGCVLRPMTVENPAPHDAEVAGRVSPSLTKTILVGLVAGFLSGLFGVGGGILMVPAMVIVLHVGQRLAHGTSLAAVLPIALSSLIGYMIAGKVEWPVAALFSVGAAGGGVVGPHFLHLVARRTGGGLVALVMIATAIRLVFDSSDAGGRAELTILTALGVIVSAVLTGILAGLLGVGGGVIMVPA